jgi:hypothetical protein
VDQFEEGENEGLHVGLSMRDSLHGDLLDHRRLLVLATLLVLEDAGPKPVYRRCTKKKVAYWTSVDS